jgi:hypothetical protein
LFFDTVAADLALKVLFMASAEESLLGMGIDPKNPAQPH